ncbi:S-acyltransferase [Psidium guajava]|nr:S-acyltransferase [Psidium guajava]
MASLSTQIFPTEVMFKWERLYHLLGRGYIYITHHLSVEAEILSLFREVNASSIEGTNLEREYRAFPHVFINFLEACRNTQETVTLARVVKARYQDRSECLEFAERSVARYKKAVKSADERVSLLVHEREKLVERLALNQTYFEHDSRDVVMKFRCEWLEGKLDDLTADIAFERDLIDNLKLIVEHHEMNAAKYKEKCTAYFSSLQISTPKSLSVGITSILWKAS